MLVYPRNGWGNTAWCLLITYFSVNCLSSTFGTGIWQQWESACFLSVTWHGEAFCGLRFRVSKIWFSFVLYFCQVWFQCLSKFFDSWSSRCVLLNPTLHLESSILKLIQKNKDFSMSIKLIQLCHNQVGSCKH
jgi:hypothetical protein